MFNTSNHHLLHKNAIKLVMAQLPKAVDMDAISGYYAPYDVEWNNIKFLVKVAKPSKKASQKRAKWFYTLKEKDHEVADFFILFAIMGGSIKAIYALPRIFSPKVYITITKLNNNMRYDYFRTTLDDLPNKIMSIKEDLPRLIKIYRDAKSMKGGANK